MNKMYNEKIAKLDTYETGDRYIYKSYFRPYLPWKIKNRDLLKIIGDNES